MREPLVLTFAVAAVATAALLAPLGAALAWGGAEQMGLSAAAAEGTVWRGRLRDARYGPFRLVDVEVRLDPASLMTGRIKLRTRSDSGAFRGGTVLIAERGGAAVEGADGELATNGLRTTAALPGPLRLQDVSVRFIDGRCAAASGRVGAVSAAGALAGAVGCRDGALLIPFRGKTLLGETALTLTVQGDGRYRAETRIATREPTQLASLRLAGFADTGGAMLRIDQGRLTLRQPNPMGP